MKLLVSDPSEFWAVALYRSVRGVEASGQVALHRFGFLCPPICGSIAGI